MPLPPGYEWNNDQVERYRGWRYREESREELEQEQQDFDPTADWDWQNEDQLGPQGEELPEGALGWRPTGDADWGEGLGAWWKKTMYNVGKAYATGREEGLQISGLREKGIVKRLGEEAGKAEIEKLKTEAKPDTEFGAEVSGIAEALKASLGAVLGGTLEGLGSVSVTAEQAIGSTAYAIADVSQGKDINWQRNWEASRMTYAALFDASIWSEMERMLDNDIRGDLAAEQLMIEKPWTLWPQLAGQLVFDPLNVVSVFTKAGRVAKITKAESAAFHTIENPALRDVVEQTAEALGKMDDAQAYQKLDDLAKSQQGLVAATEHADDIATAGKDLEELSKSYQLAGLTRDAKVKRLANQTSEILLHVVNNSDADEVFEVVGGMLKSVDPDREKAAEGIAAMMHFSDPVSLFSKAANDTTVLLSRMQTKHGDTLLKTIQELKGNKSELTKTLLGWLDDAGQEMFPSVSDMLKAEDAVKAGDKTEKMLALADRAQQLPQHVRNATRWHEKAQKVVNPTNKFFSTLYMGWSPGYAFRNWSNNTLQVFIDHGVGALLGNPDMKLAKVERFHGGALQRVEGIGEKGSLFTEPGATGETGLKAIVEAVKAKPSAPALAAGEVMELRATKQIMAKSYMDTFDKGVTAMTKAVAKDLKGAGFSDDFINKLPTYIMQNEGDITAVMNALRTDAQSGLIDLFNDIGRIDPKYKGFLESTGKWDDYAEQVLQAKTKEEATTAAQKIFDDLAQAGEYAYRDQQAIGTIDDAHTAMLVDQGDVSYQRGQLWQRRKVENGKAVDVAIKFIDQADSVAFKAGLDPGTLKPTNLYEKTVGNWGETAAGMTSRLQDNIDTVKAMLKKPGVSYPEIWNKFPEFFKGPAPEMLSKDDIYRHMFGNYSQLAGSIWGTARDEAVTKITQYFDNIERAGGQIPKEWRQVITEAQDYAKQFDNAATGRYGEILPDVPPVPVGTRASQIAQLAERYKIPTGTAQGVQLDKKILATINKYADPKNELGYKVYKDLDEVPLEVAEEAFKSKSGQPLAVSTEAGQVPLTQATDVPRDQLPEAVSQRFADEAKRLASELSGGQAERTAEGVMGTTNVSWYRELYQKGLRKPAIDKALDKIITDQGRDVGTNVERMKELILDNFKFGDKASGTPPDLYALQQLGADEKTLQEALDNFNDITGQELSLEEALRVSTPGTPTPETGELLHDPDLPYYDEAGELVEPQRKRILPAPDDNAPPTMARAIYDQREDVAKMRKWMLDDIEKNYGKKQITNKVGEKALQVAEKQLAQKLAETRLVSSRVAQVQRDFTLLNYGEKSYWDMALAYVYPYHFWYSGTYKNWMNRLVTNPAILAHYNRYKENLATVHAGMPEWWRYNLNTNDLPGFHSDNPLYFNLEATLWPLNGLTGTDFNDPSKRVNWWTSSLDYMNKFGPTTWAPINMLTGLALYANNEKEAGEKWMGRLIPQSSTIKAAGSLLGIANLETDPFVKMFQGNLDPYERRRVQRSLAEMEQEVLRGDLPYTREQLQDAAYQQEGEIWDEAVKRAVHGRAKSQLTSFLAGVGFKGRTQEDMEIDKFYSDYNKLWGMRPNLDTEEFKEGMSALKDKYPFMDTLLLSRRDDENRDAGLAYLVLQRIPPGQSGKIAEAAGVDPKLLDKFYADKGQIGNWSDADRLKFMAGVMTMSAVLEIPQDMTRKEWEQAKIAYGRMNTDAKDKWGDDILDQVEAYYAAKTKGTEAANTYLDSHPEVSEYMNWKAERVMGSDLLSAYYGGASMIEGYYKSKMYADIEKKLGEDIFEIVGEYNDLKTYGEPAEWKAYYKQHKAEISQYFTMKDSWGVYIDQQTAKLAAKLPEGTDAGVRQDYDVTSPTQNQLAGELQGGEQVDLQAVLPERLQNLMMDYFYDGDRLPESAEKQLSRLANELGFGSVEDLLQAYGESLYAAP